MFIGRLLVMCVFLIIYFLGQIRSKIPHLFEKILIQKLQAPNIFFLILLCLN
jgi:hypothetical protein